MLQLQIKRLQEPGESGIVLVLGCSDWQRDMLNDELRRLIPELAPGSGSGLMATRAGRSDSGRAGSGGGSLAASLASAAAAATGDTHAVAAADELAVRTGAATETGPGGAATPAGAAAEAAGGAAPPVGHGRTRSGIAPELPVEISNEISAQERAELYRTRYKRSTGSIHRHVQICLQATLTTVL